MRTALLIVAAFAVGVLLGLPRMPAALSPDAPPDQFSAGRAMAHVRAWAAEPRPRGSAAHARVVDGLEAELRRVGLVVTREEARGLVNLVAGAPAVPAERGGAAEGRGASEGGGPAGATGAPPAGAPPRVQSRADADPGGDGGVWLVAHSDSVPESPGAADDGLGLAVIVEAARALGVGGVPERLHVLVTDGEEEGLLGAQAHVLGGQGRGAAREARRLILNVEARGTEGPAYMFQTAGPQEPLLNAWRASRCGAQATSLARAVYERMPNDTDFTVFRRAGWWGYDFALVHGAWRYHTAEDTPANLDPRSVQQVGACVVGLARAWLGRPLAVAPDAAAPDAAAPLVYAQLAGWTVVSPPWVVRVVAALALVGLLAAWRGRSAARPVEAAPIDAPPAGTQPARTQPAGAQAAGAQAAGAQPAGTQAAGTPPAGAPPARTQPAGAQPAGAPPEGARRGGSGRADDGGESGAKRIPGTRTGVPGLVGVVVGAAAWVGAIGVAFGGGIALQALTAWARPDFWDRDAEMPAPHLHYALAFGLGGGVAWVAWRLATRVSAAARGWHFAAGLAGIALAIVSPAVGYLLVPGAVASAAMLRGHGRLAIAPALLAGVVFGPVLHALPAALTTRATPVLCVVPVLLLAWLLPIGVQARVPRGDR